jgi:hypothetical protein
MAIVCEHLDQIRVMATDETTCRNASRSATTGCTCACV